MDLGAFFDTASHHLANLLELHLRVDRADVRVLVERIPETKSLDPIRELAEHRIRDRFLDEEPRARATDMALVEVDAADDPFDRLVDRRVLEDDVGGFAAELERQPLSRSRGGPLDQLADLGGPGEGDLSDARVIDEVRARLSGAGHDVDDAGRQVRLLTDLREVESGQGRRLRGL